jgi:hypothetical protein
MGDGLAVLRAGVLICAVFFGTGLCEATEQPKASKASEASVPKDLNGIWDPAKYISIDEVRPGMEAYCLTVYKGTEVEKFPMEVLSVIRDIMPGRDAILVKGTDERFIHSGPVAGCSGSPVYIEGRLAGAMAFGWIFSKDPLYGVTPIAEMLRVGGQSPKQSPDAMASKGPGISFDFSSPIDFSQVEKKIPSALSSGRVDFGGATVLPSPLVVSGLPERVLGDLQGQLSALGFMVVSGGGAGSNPDVCDIKLVPGACLNVPLVTGDITMDVVGTVTEVRGDDVYGFGHAFLGYGEVDLPMATGEVHTVMSSVMRSFKIASAARIVGALKLDESTAVRGKLGAEAKMIPLRIKVSRYNDSQPRQYNCRIANNRILTPLLLRATVSGAVLLLGNLPPDNTVQYKGVVELDGAGEIVFENISTGEELAEMMRDSVAPVALLMNNPYRQVRIKSFDFEVCVSEKDVTSAIWSVGLSGSRVKSGESVDVEVVTESFLAEKRKYAFSFVVPENTPPGIYQLIVCGGQAYEDFLRKAVPHRFMPENLETLVAVINDILAIGRDELHCILVLPGGGVALESAELPELPATKALVLGDARRAITMQAYPGWIDKSVRTGSIIIDRKIMNITVEQ